ncbi:hypothetical protein [Endozoicomonas atrinae]|uniref:hypothetical protein n=1 Tax=Endozoicomonas atrinae TaxID=1333660 RepID=UPI003B00C328
MDCIDFLWNRVTHAMAEEMKLREAENETCYCCNRHSSQWIDPRYEWRVDSYIRLEVPICAPCNALFHGSYQFLGIEKGTEEKPVAPGKLGMLVGCGLIVTQTKAILLTNPGWDKRLRAAKRPLFTMVQVSGKSAAEYAITTIRSLPDAAFPLLYISDIGRKKAELIQHMEYSLSRDLIYSCSSDPAIKMDMQLIDTMRALATSNKSGWKKLERFIFNACHGRIAPNDAGLREFLLGWPEALAFAQKLPADPHEKLKLLRCV